MLSLLFVAAPSSVYALTNAQKDLLKSGVHYFDIAGSECAVGGDDGGTTSLTGNDNIEKAFNYFKNAGLGDVQAAAIVGNLVAESSVNPKSNQGGGPGMGIAQWSNPGRWNDLEKFAADKDKFSLSVQLDFLWHELNTSKKPALDATKKQTNVSDATAFFMGTAAAGTYPGNVVDSVTDFYIRKYGRQSGFENPGSPHLDHRISNAKKIIKNFGNGDTGESPVTGIDAPTGCESAGAVDCSNPTAADDTSTASLSVTRQNAVCVAEAEFQKWKSGAMKPGTDFYKYSQGRNEEWCADFVSWVYNQAGYPLSSAKGGNVAAVLSIQQIGQKNQKFTYHTVASGYTPVPGDLAIHLFGSGGHHVNMVVSVNTNKKSMTLIGGNQAGTTRANTTSKVTKDTVDSYSYDSIVGFVSPKE